MGIQNIFQAQKSAKTQVLHEISSKCRFSMANEMARGAGFEPARPIRTTGLAGLPPTRLGQPRETCFVKEASLRKLLGFSVE